MEKMNLQNDQGAGEQGAKSDIGELSLAQLSLVGGGCGEVIFG